MRSQVSASVSSVLLVLLAVAGLASAGETGTPFHLSAEPHATGVLVQVDLSSAPELEYQLRGARSYGLPWPRHTQREVQPGRPDLPIIGRLVALPPGAEPVLRIESLSYGDDITGVRVLPVGRQMTEGLIYVEDKRFYDKPGFEHNLPVRLSERGIARDLDFVRLEVRPFLYDPVRSLLRPVKSVRLWVDYQLPSDNHKSDGRGDLGLEQGGKHRNRLTAGAPA